nr:PREDICTED: uncharacterized protein LOC109037039 isoform X3 [Bemisia tabaci]
MRPCSIIPRMVTHHSSNWGRVKNAPFQIETQPLCHSSFKSESPDLGPESPIEWKNIFSMRQMNLATLAGRQSGIRETSMKAQKIRSRYIMSASKSLDILRQNLQSALNDDIDNVIKSYLQKYFAPAVTNIRLNMGDASVKEEQIREVCRTILENAKLMYANSPVSKSKCSPTDVSQLIDCRLSKNYSSEKQKRLEKQGKQEDVERPKATFMVKSKGTSGELPTNSFSRRNSISDELIAYTLKRPIPDSVNLEMNALNSQLNNNLNNPLNGSLTCDIDNMNSALSSPLQDSLNESLHESIDDSIKLKLYESPSSTSDKSLFSLASPLDSESKWSPSRIKANTLFVISPCNVKDIGIDSELLLQHPELFRYTVDQEDLDWLVIQKQIILPLDSILSINLLLLDDVIELAMTEQHRNNPFCSLSELKGFELPDFMLNKVRACLSYSNPISIDDNENPLEINATLNLAIDYITSMTPPFCSLDSEMSTTGVESFNLLEPLPQSTWDSSLTSSGSPLADSHSTLSALLSGHMIAALNN